MKTISRKQALLISNEILLTAERERIYHPEEPEDKGSCPVCEMIMRPDHNFNFCMRCGRDLRDAEIGEAPGR